MGLNQYQQAFVDNLGKGPCILSAAAGSGKTHTFKETVLALLRNGINAKRILAVTFTNKAASEMRVRIAKAVWPNITDRELSFWKDPKGFQDEDSTPFDEQFTEDWVNQDPVRYFMAHWVCTIHAMSFRLLKVVIPNLKTPRKPDEWKLNEIIRDSLDEYKWVQSPKIINWYIDLAVRDMLDYNDSKKLIKYFGEQIEYYNYGLFPEDVAQDAPEMLSEIYHRYIGYLRKRNMVNFGMMQADLLVRLRTDQNFRKVLQGMFDYVICDEGQDTDHYQAETLWTLADIFHNISVIGDSRQSIYQWRGAEPALMEDLFDKRWGREVKRFDLPINYRSSKMIVKISNRLIKANYQGERAKYLTDSLARDDAPDGEPPDYLEYGKFSAMCQGLIQEIMAEGNYGNWFVLSRTRAECAMIHTAMVKAGLPAINLNGGSLFGSAHIRKVMAYAKLACNYQNARNNKEILVEVANIASNRFLAPMTRRRHEEGCSNEKHWIDCGCPVVVREGVDFSTVRYYGEKAIDTAGGRWSEIVKQQYMRNFKGEPHIYSKGATDFVGFVTELERLKDDAAAVLKKIIEESVEPWLLHEEGEGGEDPSEDSKTEDFDMLLNMVKENMTLEQFIDDADAFLKKGTNLTEEESVLIMTVHKSKGLERPLVALNLTRCPIVPPRRKEGQLPTGFPSTLEQERNLAYVGFTRAKEKCLVIASREWNGQNTPRSPFISEFGFVMEEPELEESESEEDDNAENLL